MNEEALKDAYGLFTQSGYNGTQDEFYTLLSENAEAFADSYGLFKGSGYNGSEDDYKELLGLKKKDSSMPQGTSAQVDTEVSTSVSEGGQSSLEQKTQLSLDERLASNGDVSKEEKIKISKQEDKRPFFEAQGLDYDKFLKLRKEKTSAEYWEKIDKEELAKLSFFERWYKIIREDDNILEEDPYSTARVNYDTYFSENKDKIRSAEINYDNALIQSIARSSQSLQEFSESVEKSGVDLNNIRMSAITIDGREASINEALDYWLDTDNVNAAQEGETLNFSIEVPDPSDPNYESLKYVEDLMNRQINSGSRYGDIVQNFMATFMDLSAGLLEEIEKAPAALDQLPLPVMLDERYEEEFKDMSGWDYYMTYGGYYANKVRDYAKSIRENTRIPEEESIYKSLISGNYEDAFFNSGNAVANAIPFTLSIGVGSRLIGPTKSLLVGGGAAGGMKSLELKERRRIGIEQGTRDADITNWQIHFSEAATIATEAFFEKYTLRILNQARKAGGGKTIVDPGLLLDSYLNGIKKSMFIETSSEVATEGIQYLSDVAVELEDFDSGEFGVRLIDTSIASILFSSGMYTTVRGAKDITKNLNIINNNTSVIFTNENGETREVSRGEAVNLVKDPEIAQQIRDGKIKVDYSLNNEARQAIDDLVYGNIAPDAQQAKAKMFEKEKVVSNLSKKINQSKQDAKANNEDYEVSTEDVSNLAKQLSELNLEAKKSKYNVTESTKAVRAQVKEILDDNNIEIVDAVDSQDISISNVNETVDATKIDSQEQYNSVKNQLKNGKRKPTIVQSQNQSGIRVNGETIQTSEITQGRFKSVSAARNAMKDFEFKRDAAKKGEILDSELFPINNKIFTNTQKQNLDEIPQEVIDNNDYYILSSQREGLTEKEISSRMENLKSTLDKAGATYYTVQGIYNGVAEESLVVTGIDNATALNIGNQFQQESIFSSKNGLMFGDGRVVPLNGDVVKGPDARKRKDITIMNIGGRKVSMHMGLDEIKTSYGKNFNSDNIHKLDESNANYDAELFQGLDESRKRALGFAFKLLNSIGGLNITVIRNSKAMEEQLKAIGQDPSKKMSSFFRGSNKTIYVNLETIQGNTLFQEIIHPMVDFIKKNDADLYERIEAEVQESDVKRRVMKDGRRMKGSYLDWSLNNYTTKEEVEAYYNKKTNQFDLEKFKKERPERFSYITEQAFAEMMGDAAYGHFLNKQSNLSRIRGVIREILSRIGIVSPFENVEAIDLNQMSLSDVKTNLSEALVNGRKITVGGVEFEVGDIDRLAEIREKNPKLFSEPNPETADISKSYLSDKATELGIDQYSDPRFVNRLDEDNSKMIADAYDSLVDDPKNPQVIRAYKALADETLEQYKSIINKGYKIEIWKGEGEPYANSAEMIQDVRDNKHLYIFGTEAGFGEGVITPEQRQENIMLSRTEYQDVNGEPLVVNDIFRFVHDFFGHTEIGNGFGPIGEENAWLNHSRMYSSEARKAMTTETRGQNSWVNYNKNIRREDGTIPKKGDKDYVPLSERPFADQKMGILPDNIVNPVGVKSEVISDIITQAPQEESENVVYTSGLTTIAFDIAQSVVDADYKAGKYTTKAIASIPFLKIDKPRKQFEGYDIRLSKLLAKPFGSHSNEEIKEIMVRNRGDLQVELLRVDDNLRLLKNTIKDSNITPEQVNDLLHNVEDIKAMEKSELRTALIEMRTHIDELSRTLIREGLVAGQTMFTIDSNMGLYITRSYRQFETKNWEQTDNDIIQNAKDFLYREVKNQNIRDVKDGKIDKDGNLITLMSEDAILNKAGEAYDKLVEEKDFLKFSGGSSSLEGLTRVNSIFMQKKVIPKEIRELWGEIDSPLINYSNTISKVAKTISAERMYRELNNIGQGKFISNKRTPSTRNNLKGSKWGDLDGKWVDDEMYVVMNQVNRTFEKNGFQRVYDLYMQLVLFNKKMKTVWNPGTHSKNIIGNSSFAMMNGHLTPDLKQIYQDGKLSIEAFKSTKSEEFKELYNKLIRLGVVNSSASLAEIQNISEDLRNTKFDLTEYINEKNGKIQKRIAKVSGTIKQGISSFDEKLMRAYQAEDDVWKIFGYLSERGRYIKAGLDVAVAEEMAAKNIRNLYPNYNEIPRIIRFLGRSPLVGSFVAFQAESVRNAKNTVMLGFEEMGSNNSKIRRIGATRIAGTIATMTLMEGLQLYTAQFLGEFLGFGGEDDDDVERRKMRLLLPEYDAPGNIAYMFRGFLESKQSEDQTERDRYFDYINFSSISGVGYIKDIMRLAFTDIDTQLGQDSALNILEKIYAPFLGEEMTSIAVREAVTNKNGKVFDETDHILTKVGKMIIYVGDKVQPGVSRVVQRGVESVYDEDSELVPGYEMLAIFGIRINRVNVNKGLAIKSNFLHKDMISRVGKEVLQDPFALREEARKNSSFNEDLNKLADLIAAARLNSINGENVKAILSSSRVSKTVIDEAYNRYLDRYLEDAISIDDK